MSSILFAAALMVAPPAAQVAPAPASTPAPVVPEAPTKLTVDTPIATIVADPKGKAVLTADLGGDVSQHPMYESFKSMTLGQLAPMSQGRITDETLKKVAADLAAIK